MATIEDFEKILRLEDQFADEHRSFCLGGQGLLDNDTTRARKGRRIARDRARKAFFDAFDALTPDEMRAYGDYRRERR